MKEIKYILNEFTDLFANSLCIVCLLLSGFMIFINLYHYKEISYTVSNEYLSSEEYNNNKNKIKNMLEQVNKVTGNKVATSDYFIFSQTQIKLQSCLTSLEESKFYTFSNNYVTSKDLYDFNNELATTLQYKCLFEVDYAITNGIKEYKSSIKYNLSDEVNAVKNDLTIYGNYLKNQLLGNGSYYYSTENSKISIYNENVNYYNLTIDNYNKLLDEVSVLVNYFNTNFGR